MCHMYSLVNDKDVFSFLEGLTSEKLLAIDTETYYVPNQPERVIRFLGKDDSPNNTPFLITLSSPNGNWAIEINKFTIGALKHFLETSSCEKIFFNASYDLQMLANIGIRVSGKIHDVMVMHNLIDEEDMDEEGNYVKDLKGLAVKYLADDSNKFELEIDRIREEIAKETGKKKGEISYYDVYKKCPVTMVDYACSDTQYTLILFKMWNPVIDEEGLRKIYNIEMDCVWAVVNIELRGHKVDYVKLEKLEEDLVTALTKLEQEIWEINGEEFNINSDEQLVHAFMKQGAEYTAMTDKGNWQTNRDALTPFLSHKKESVAVLAEKVLEYRDGSKTLNTFVKGLKTYRQLNDRVHPSFWLAGTRTGRMSSSKPNFQNISRKEIRLRELFIPEDDYILVYIDYSQQEYRLLAHYAKEENLIEMINKGYDVHRATASMMFNVEYDEVTDEQRDSGKTLNFA